MVDLSKVPGGLKNVTIRPAECERCAKEHEAKRVLSNGFPSEVRDRRSVIEVDDEAPISILEVTLELSLLVHLRRQPANHQLVLSGVEDGAP